MKRKIGLGLLLLACGVGSLQAQTPEKLWDQANTAYINENYQDAVKGYEMIRAQGRESEKLYLNLGNAYFKRNMTGKAILNYHRALRLAPTDEDVLYNLSIANTRIQDKIEEVPTFFLKRWLAALSSSMTSNGWAAMSLICFTGILALLLVYLLLGGLRWRKIGFWGALGALGLFFVSVWFAASQRNAILHPASAIVMTSTAPVKSSPDASSKDIFVLHEGTPVLVRDSIGAFREITIGDGNKGWIAAAAIEIID